jgi:hypothetical protein
MSTGEIIERIASRKREIAPHVLFVDGMSGSGKIVLLSALQSLERVENHRMEHIYEYLCTLYYLGRIKEDAAISLIRLYTDLHCYNNMISREVNMRPSDLSSVLNGPKKDLYLSRLKGGENEDAFKRIKEESPILHIMTHENLGMADPLFTALGERCSLIRIVRHPLFVLTSWYAYMDKYAIDPQDFTVCFEYKEKDAPWFTIGWEETFFKSNRMDRSIRTVKFLIEHANNNIPKLREKGYNRFLLIPFEKFVIEPWEYIGKIETLLNTTRTSITKKVLSEQNIPRKISTDIPDGKIISRYGYEKMKKNATEESEVLKQWDFIKKEASAECIAIMEELSNDYENTFLS